MLKMSKVYTLAEILSKIFVKSEGKLGSLFTYMVPTSFLLRYIMRSLLAQPTPLYTENVDLKRIGKLPKMGLFFDLSLDFYYKLSHYRSTKNAY